MYALYAPPVAHHTHTHTHSRGSCLPILHAHLSSYYGTVALEGVWLLHEPDHRLYTTIRPRPSLHHRGRKWLESCKAYCKGLEGGWATDWRITIPTPHELVPSCRPTCP